MPMINQEIMTVEEVATLLRVSERTVYEWAQKGAIPCGKLGTAWRFKREEVMRWVDSNLSSASKDKTRRPVQDYFLLKDVLTTERITITGKSTKEQALRKLCDLLATSDDITDSEELTRKIFYRESLMSTGIGLGCGIPHGRLDCVKKPVMAVGIFADGIADYSALDKEPVKIIFMIAAGTGQHEEYVKLLAKVSDRMKDDDFRNRLVTSKSIDQAWEILTSPHISE